MKEEYQQITFDDYDIPYKFITTKSGNTFRLSDRLETVGCLEIERQAKLSNTLIRNKPLSDNRK